MDDGNIFVTEGKAQIKLPNSVFYNRVQEFNRDITVAMVSHYGLLHRMELFLRFKKKILNNTKNDEVGFTYKGLRILEALSATGLRSVRFAREIPYISKVIANDIDPLAVSVIEENVRQNDVSDYIDITCSNAIKLMYECCGFEKLDVVDIDPYGTASPFLDSAVQCLNNGGLLCVTSTDMAVLCGSSPGTSMGKYGGLAVNNCASHELGLRILLNAIQSAASRHGKVIEPLLSLNVDFYARIFVRVWSSPKGVKSIAAKHGICFTCPGCFAYYIQPLGMVDNSPRCIVPARGPCVGPTCQTCGTNFTLCGPLWIGQLHSQPFLYDFLSGLGYTPNVSVSKNSKSSLLENLENELKSLDLGELLIAPNLTPLDANGINKEYGTLSRIVGMSTMAYEELPDVPLYYRLDKLCSVASCIMPPLVELHSSLLNAGFRVSLSHADKGVLKTDAPHEFIMDSILSHNHNIKSDLEEGNEVKSKQRSLQLSTKHSHKKRKRSDSSSQDDQNGKLLRRDAVRQVLLSRPLNPNVDFTIHPNANPPSRLKGLLRFQLNPEKNWGPKSKPKVKKLS